MTPTPEPRSIGFAAGRNPVEVAAILPEPSPASTSLGHLSREGAGEGAPSLREGELGGRAIELSIKRLDPRAAVPVYQTDLAAGLDLAACLSEAEEAAGGIRLAPIVKGGRVVLVRCGFAMSIPAGFEAQVRPRSGLASKFGVTMPNAPGTIDADYRGEVSVPLINLGQEEFVVRHGMRIAQMVIARVEHAAVREVGSIEELGATRRGSGGFGSTGH